MKLTDLAITFQIFFICLIVVLHVKSDGIYAAKFNSIMYDNVMDGIVEDSLRAGYKTVDASGKPIVDFFEMERCFNAEVMIYSSNLTYVLFYVDDDGFYVKKSRVSDSWGEKIAFSNKADTIHQQKVYEVTSYMEENLGLKMSIPYNLGESFMNTIDSYTFIAISTNREQDIISFSGAKIHKK